MTLTGTHFNRIQVLSLAFRSRNAGTVRVRPIVAESSWITREQIHQIRQLDRLGSSTTGRGETIIVRLSPESMVDVFPDTSTGYSTVPGVRYGFDPRSKYIADLEEKEERFAASSPSVQSQN